MAVTVIKVPTSNTGAAQIFGSEHTSKRLNLTAIFSMCWVVMISRC